MPPIRGTILSARQDSQAAQMTNPSAPIQTEGPAIPASNAYRWYVVGLLLLVSVLAYLDRLVMSLLIQPIKVDMGLTDTQAAILSAGAFAVFYILMGVPLGRMVDKKPRPALLAICMAFWSAMCAACGFAVNFLTLFLARAGVGVGEAALNPAAISIISDYFKKNEVAQPLSYYSLGVYAGGGFALLLGGQMIAWALTLPPMHVMEGVDLSGWRLVFIAAGLPGLIVAPLVWLTIRELKSRGAAPGGEAVSTAETASIWPYLKANARTFSLLGLGFVAFGFNIYALLTWNPAMMQRSFGWTPQDIAFAYGWVYLIGGTSGGLLAPVLMRWLQARGAMAPAVTLSAVGCALMAGSSVAAPLMPTMEACLAVTLISLFTWALTLSLSFVVLASATPGSLRGAMTGVYMVVMNASGGILGPLLVGWMTDHWLGAENLNVALAIIGGVFMPIAVVSLWAARRGHAALERTV
jgi:MFS family permease